jgi:hypothetical protein
MLRCVLAVLLSAWSLAAAGPVYVTLWFDTEDYIEPASDDAALRIAKDLTAEGVRATFKVVGEKARVLEQRGRRDVISALSRHAIGYHSNWHSVHPTPSEYLVRLGYLDGADEFERREGPGIADVKRVFGVQPVCYGQPGSSWGPQSNLALRRLGIPVYLDEGTQVGVEHQPFWYGGLLYVFQMGENQFRARLNVGAEDAEAYKRFDEAAARLASRGGGMISIYYHPNEFVTTEFWDGVNFTHGANPDRASWVRPHRRTPDESERCYGVLRSFVRHMKKQAGVRFVTASDLVSLYQPRVVRPVSRQAAADRLKEGITFGEVSGQMLSPADMLLALLDLKPQVVDGPVSHGETTWRGASIPGPAFRRAVADAAAFVEKFHRLPDEVFIGAETLSLTDFTATLANVGRDAREVRVVQGQVGFDKYFSKDGVKSFGWVIHPEGFDGSKLLEMGRMQGWTLKPARLSATDR